MFYFTWHDAIAADRQWYSLTIDGNRVGYAWHDHDRQSGSASDSEVMRIEVVQLRKRVALEIRNEVIRSSAGLPQRMDVESIIGTTRNGWQGTLSADARTLSVVVSAAAGARTFAVPVDLILPDRLSEALKPLWREGRREVEVQYLEPTAAKPIELRAELLSSPNTEPHVTQVRTSETIGHQSHQEIIWIGQDGLVLHRERKFFGATLVWERCLRDCDSQVDKPFDLMSKLVVQSPYRIPPGAFAGPIRYVISRVDGDAPRIPATGEQAVVMDGSTAILTVCATCGVPEQLTESERRRYLQSNAWVQSELPEIRDFANRHGRRGTQRQIMDNLVIAVRNHMTGPVDYLGYGSAAEALRTRSGDCTEYAVLLAALARARDIPSRVAYGLVYADRFSGKKDVFSPHAWVQVWTGTRWQSYDAGIGEFDATHLALGLGDGDPRDVQAAFVVPADLRIEKLGRVH
ncbi:MAG: transglutaminase protein [Gammaproteobacteria bacterium]|nr:transglutaminase protein [Gammaproteobacteria bacterium]